MAVGRMVMAYDRPGGTLVQVFQVGIEDPVAAVEAILQQHPELDQVHLQVGTPIDPTAVAFAELEPGEVRSERTSHIA